MYEWTSRVLYVVLSRLHIAHCWDICWNLNEKRWRKLKDDGLFVNLKSEIRDSTLTVYNFSGMQLSIKVNCLKLPYIWFSYMFLFVSIFVWNIWKVQEMWSMLCVNNYEWCEWQKIVRTVQLIKYFLDMLMIK